MVQKDFPFLSPHPSQVLDQWNTRMGPGKARITRSPQMISHGGENPRRVGKDMGLILKGEWVTSSRLRNLGTCGLWLGRREPYRSHCPLLLPLPPRPGDSRG